MIWPAYVITPCQSSRLAAVTVNDASRKHTVQSGRLADMTVNGGHLWKHVHVMIV